MGLNWGQALENAGAGLDRMSKQKTWEADIQYKEMAAENRRRFAAEESGKQRDFLSSEAQTKRDWEEPFKTEGLELQKEQIRISGDIRQTQMEQNDYWKKIQAGQTEQRILLEKERGDESARANTVKETRLSKDDLMGEYNKELERLKEKRDAINAKLDDKFFTSEEERTKLSQEMTELDTYEEDLGVQKDRGLDFLGLSTAQQGLYDKASSNIASSDPAALHDISMKYAKLSEAKRAKLEETAKQLLESGEAQNEDQARARAINDLSGGKSLKVETPAPSAQATPPAAPIEEATLPAPGGTPPQAVAATNEFVPPPRTPTGRRGEVPTQQHPAGSGPEATKESKIKSLASHNAKKDGRMKEFMLDKKVYQEYLAAAAQEVEREMAPAMAASGGPPAGASAGSL